MQPKSPSVDILVKMDSWLIALNCGWTIKGLNYIFEWLSSKIINLYLSLEVTVNGQDLKSSRSKARQMGVTGDVKPNSYILHDIGY